MRWSLKAPEWERRFAVLPVQIGDEFIWLEWYWARYCGNELGDAWEVRTASPGD